MELVIQSIGLGLVVSLIFSEFLGLAAGGMVVPGYIALMIDQPIPVLGTIFVSYLTYLGIKFFSGYMFIYGRRRTVITIILGFVLGWLFREFMVFRFPSLTMEIQVIGYIIPGLIAVWMERQGVIETISTMILAAIFVRLSLMIFSGGIII